MGGSPRPRLVARRHRFRSGPRLRGWLGAHGWRLLRRIPSGPNPPSCGHWRRAWPWHRELDHRIPSQVPPAGVPPPVPRPSTSPRRTQPADVGNGPRRRVHLDDRRRIRHRSRNDSLRLSRSPRWMALARTRGAAPSCHRAAAHARPWCLLLLEGNPARPRRLRAALHRWSCRSSKRRRTLR